EGHSADDVSRVSERFGSKQSKHADAKHPLRAIDERYGFFSFERDRLDLVLAEGIAGRNPAPVLIDAFTFPDQFQREMRKWGEITARANAALRRNEWRYAAIKHLANGVDKNSPHARVTLGERVRSQ